MVPAFAAVHHHNRFVQEEAVHGSSDIAEVKVLLLVAVNFKIQHKIFRSSRLPNIFWG